MKRDGGFEMSDDDLHALTTNTALQQELAALREDKAILDWLGKSLQRILSAHDGGVWLLDDDNKGVYYPALRDAARDAMKGGAK